MKVISISEIKFYQNTIPVAVLVDEEQNPVGYLAPFRGYRFQVSETFEGVGDLGSCPVFGIKNVLYSMSGGDVKQPTDRFGYNTNLGWNETAEMLLKGAALIAIQKFSELRGRTVAIQLDTGDHKECRAISNGRYLWNCLATPLDKFIMETINWLAPEIATGLTKESI